jgi:hypothetical protein
MIAVAFYGAAIAAAGLWFHHQSKLGPHRRHLAGWVVVAVLIAIAVIETARLSPGIALAWLGITALAWAIGLV